MDAPAVNELAALVVVGAGIVAGLGYSFGALKDAGAFRALGQGLRLLGAARAETGPTSPPTWPP